jgi:hypothetical protein
MQLVMPFINNNSPHAVPMRHDIGFLVSIGYPKRSGMNMFNANPNDMYEQQPLFAVTGYTDFVRSQNAMGMMMPNMMPGMPQHQYDAIPVITEISSYIPSRQIIGLSNAIFAYLFITMGRWRDPYATFNRKDGSLGPLIIQPDNTPFPINNIQELNQFINMYVAEPRTLGLEITEGRFRIPGIDRYVHNQQAAAQDIADLTGLDVNFIIDQFAFQQKLVEVSGLVDIVDHGLVSSAEIDYLKLAAKTNGNFADLKNFVQRPLDPLMRMRQIANVIGDQNVQRLYMTQRVFLQSSLTNKIAGAVANNNSKYRMIFVDQFANNLNLDTAQMLNGCGMFNTMPQIGRNFGPMPQNAPCGVNY